ncbi:MAG TPA: amidohydrolase family protein [Acidimicrobiales bacterium]
MDLADGIRVVDAHTHVMRSADHGRELWSYFLRRPASEPGPPALHTLEEAEQLMDATGVSHMNILMFTWSGRYWRDGQHTLPDDGPARAGAAEELRSRIVDRVRANNEWAVQAVESRSRFSFFCGIDASLMTTGELLAEIDDKTRRGALGVKMVPFDSGVSGNDPRLWPVYDYLQERGIPLLTEASGRPGAPGRPALFAPALHEFPRLKLVFAHLGRDPAFAHGADQEVVELARGHQGVFTDLSLRLPEMLNGAFSASEMVEHLRRIGTDRVLFGTNYGFVDTVNQDPDHRAGDGPQVTWAQRTLVAFLELPLQPEELTAIASGNWNRLTTPGP